MIIWWWKKYSMWIFYRYNYYYFKLGNSLHEIFQVKRLSELLLSLQIEARERVEEFKTQKKEEESLRKLEDEVWERAQKDQQKEIAARELVKFRERVGFWYLWTYNQITKGQISFHIWINNPFGLSCILVFDLFINLFILILTKFNEYFLKHFLQNCFSIN